MAKENAHKFLRNSSETPFAGMSGELNEYSDGSQYFYGSDGSTGVKYTDGSSSFDDSGGHGTKYADGYSSYSNNDGSHGTRYSDGSVTFHDEGESNNEDEVDRSSGNVVLGFGGALVFAGLFAILAATSKKSNCDEEEIIQETAPFRLSKQPSSHTPPSSLSIFLIVLLSFAIMIGSVAIFHFSNLIAIGFDSAQLTGLSCEDVASSLSVAGFQNISIIDIHDLSLETEDLEGTVSYLTIDGESVFSPETKFPKDAIVIIYRHTLKLCHPPLSAKEANGIDYRDILQQFTLAGFVNIQIVPQYDLIFGWFSQDGAVAKISIDNDAKFLKDTEYRPDASVVITYHTYRSDRP